MSKCVVSCHESMVSSVGGVGWWRNPCVIARRLGVGDFGDDVGDYVISQRPLNFSGFPPP